MLKNHILNSISSAVISKKLGLSIAAGLALLLTQNASAQWPDWHPGSLGGYGIVADPNGDDFTPSVNSHAYGNCQFWYPNETDLNNSGKLHPLIVVGEGTGEDAAHRTNMWEHLASHGFIVAGSADLSNGDGVTMKSCRQMAINMHNSGGYGQGHRIQGHVDTSRICAYGMSQGGAGAIMTGADSSQGIDCTVLMAPFVFGPMPADQNNGQSVLWCIVNPAQCFGAHWNGYNPANEGVAKGPTLMLTGYHDAVIWNPVSQNPQHIWDAMNSTDLMWAEHDSYGQNAALLYHSYGHDLGPFKEPITAFFRDVLMGDASDDHWYRGNNAVLKTHGSWDEDGPTVSKGAFWDDSRRVGVRVGRELWVKQGSLNAGWRMIHGNIDDFEMTGNRIGVRVGRQLWVKEGAIDAGWNLINGDIDDFKMDGNRIGVRVGSWVYVKEGGLGAGWVAVTGGAQDFDLSGNRIGVIANRAVHVKEGGLGAGWVLITGAADRFQLSGNRIAVWATNRQLHVKEGGLGAGWSYQSGNVDKFYISGNRIAVWAANSKDLHVKEGGLGAGWVLVSGDVHSDFKLAGNRIGVRSGETVHIKEGGLGAGWTYVRGEAADFGMDE